jgi:hypothetical protein
MSLFAILGMPSLTIFLLFADGKMVPGSMAFSRHEAPDRTAPVLEFIKGFFYAVPCLVVILLLRRYVPLSYRSFPLYLLFLLTDHLIPVVFLGVLYFLVYARKGYGSLLAFGGGFYSLVGIVNIFTQYGRFEPYHLFLLPVTRMAGLLFLTIFFLRFQEWYGLVRLLFLILLISVPFLSGTITFLYMKSYLLWAIVLTVLFFLGSLLYTYLERKW